MGELPQSSALLHVRLQRQSEQLVPFSQVGADVHGILLWPLGGLAFVGERCAIMRSLIQWQAVAADKYSAVFTSLLT